MKSIVFLVILLITPLSQSFGLEIVTVNDFKTANKSTDKIIKTELIHYINGIGVGMLAYNTYLDSFQKEKVFCFPENDFEVDFYKIMEASLMGTKHKDNDPIPPILFYEIADRFPCKKESNISEKDKGKSFKPQK